MKESERLKLEADKEENDLAYMGKYKKYVRQKRAEIFEESWLVRIRERCEVHGYNNSKLTFSCNYGIVDYFPRSNKLLIRKKNRWHKSGLKFIIKNILNETPK